MTLKSTSALSNNLLTFLLRQSRIVGQSHILFITTDHEIGHGHDIHWTLRAKKPELIKTNSHCTSWIAKVIATAGLIESP